MYLDNFCYYRQRIANVLTVRRWPPKKKIGEYKLSLYIVLNAVLSNSNEFDCNGSIVVVKRLFSA